MAVHPGMAEVFGPCWRIGIREGFGIGQITQARGGSAKTSGVAWGGSSSLGRGEAMVGSGAPELLGLHLNVGDHSKCGVWIRVCGNTALLNRVCSAARPHFPPPMRLVTRKIYRAFPELDRFSDEQCERYIRAANAVIWRRVVRGAVAVAIALIIAAVGIRIVVPIAQELSDRWRLDDLWYWLLWGTLLTLALLVSFVPGLVVADVLLRLRVRSLLKRCGTCPLCHYSLLGMRVGSDLIVTCPECGHKVKVEPAFGELATDGSGAAVYRLEIVRDDEVLIALRRRRRVRMLRWSAVCAGSLILLLGGTAGGLEWFVRAQAATARGARMPSSTLREIQLNAHGEGSDVERGEAWTEFIRLIAQPNATMKFVAGEMGDNQSYWLSMDPSVLRDPDRLPQNSQVRKMPGKERERQIRFVRAVVRECRSDGAFESLKSIKKLSKPLRPLPEHGGMPLRVVYGGEEIGLATTLVNVETARMVEAVKNSDLEDYLAAMDESFQTLHVLDGQMMFIDRVVVNGLRSTILRNMLLDASDYPDTRWHAAVVQRLVEHERRPPFAPVLRILQEQSRDYLHWFFSDPVRVRNLMLGVTDYNDDPDLRGVFQKRPNIGTYQRNLEALDANFEFWLARADMPSAQMAIAPPGTRGLDLVEMMTQWTGTLISSQQNARLEYRVAMLGIAVEQFRREHSRSPTQVEMSELGIPREMMGDPNSGVLFGVRMSPAGSPHSLPFEVVGGDTGLADPKVPEQAP